MIYAASALQNTNIETCDIELLITPDEEIGSPISRQVIEKRAKNALAVFNLESGRPDGSVVTSRRGSSHFKFTIQGKASHSGVAIEKGISAVDELAYKIIEMKKLNNKEKGITLNIGKVSGGTNGNVVAAEAIGAIHVGYSKNEDFKILKEKLNSIVSTSYISGTKNCLTGGEGILPMEKHEGVEELFQIVKEAALNLNITVDEKSEKGAADAGFVASLGVPIVCATGPIGGGWHTEDEYMEIDSYIPRMKLLVDSIVLASNRMSNTLNR
ncbi:hypothetical protein GCM10009001_24670 [Virgibacillus siamensis]|uniref:Peptidase M20 dimerisation domain-containing protein n=2 Tax=Virgibacillus siamensis TaxID=480071 RepID=A0ABP3RAW9_9BACI